MLNFVLCDDEANMLKKIVLKTSDYTELLSYVSNNLVNVVVLDIEFKNTNLNGLDIANEIRKINKTCYIIFITSHFEYVMEAYDYKTFAYLFKSALSVETLSKTLARLYEDISGNTRKFIKIDNKGTFVDLNEIQFIEKNGMKLIYHTDNELLEVYNSFSKIENSNFVRCHKSFIANINNISSISLADGTILFKNNETCYIGPKYKDSFMEVIDYDTSLK